MCKGPVVGRGSVVRVRDRKKVCVALCCPALLLTSEAPKTFLCLLPADWLCL